MDTGLHPLTDRRTLHLRVVPCVAVAHDAIQAQGQSAKMTKISVSGNEYPAIVEMAPFPKVPRKKTKRDVKCGSLEDGKFFSVLYEGYAEAARVTYRCGRAIRVI